MSNKNSIETQCIMSFAVYDSCRQQTPLIPNMMDPPFSAESSEVVIFADGEATMILPGMPAILPTTVTSTRMVPDSFNTQITISNVEPSPFQENHYTFDIIYLFTMKMELYNAAGDLVPVELDILPNPTMQDFLTIGTQYIFKGDLCGGNAQSIVAATNFLAPNVLYDLTLPFVRVESKANLLQATIEVLCADDFCSFPITYPSQSQLTNDPYDPYAAPDDPINYFSLTIGLFAIYELIRPVALSTPSVLLSTSSEFEASEANIGVTAGKSNVGCTLPPCEKIDPCTYFNNMPFPFTDFDPDSC